MAKFNSEEAVFKLDDSGGVLRDLTAHLLEVNGLPAAGEMRDITKLGDTVGHKFHRGIENVTFSIRGLFDDTATTGPNVVIRGLRTLTTSSSFEYGPSGGTTAKVKYSGECFLTNFVEVARVGSMVEFTADFQVNGGVTVGTFA